MRRSRAAHLLAAGLLRSRPGAAALSDYLAQIIGDDDLIAFWRMDDAAGPLVDAVAGNNATLAGSVTLSVASTYIDGDGSDAAGFDGSSGYASIGDIAALEFGRTDPFTFLAIAKPIGVSVGQDYWIYTKTNPSSPFNGLMFGLRSPAGTSLEVFLMFVADYPTQAVRRISNNQQLQNDTEYLVGATYDRSGSAAGVAFYVDGVYAGNEDGGGSTSGTIADGQDTTASGHAAEISRRGSLNKWFKGNLKDLAIFDTAKSAHWMRLLADKANPPLIWTDPVYTVRSPRPQVFYDVDMDSDIDDVVDAVLMLNLEARGELDIVGAVVTSANAKAAPAWLAIANYYGRSNIPTGANTDSGGTSTTAYADTIAATYGVVGKTDVADFDAALTVQRSILAAAADNSVEYITTGDLSSVKALLESSADGYSALNGVDLVALKMRSLWIVGGRWPSGAATSDFSTNKTRTDYVFQNWPTSVPIVLVNISDGDTVFTGENVMVALSASNPARAAWELYFAGSDPADTREGWSQIGILPLARGLYGHSVTDVDYSEIVGHRGTASIDTGTGATSWTDSTDSNHSYIGKTLSDSEYVAAINALLHEPL